LSGPAFLVGRLTEIAIGDEKNGLCFFHITIEGGADRD
jgi:hypothetical protein